MSDMKTQTTIVAKAPKERNPYAVLAWQRSGAGKHKDQKRSADKEKCRQKVETDEE